MGKRSMSVFKLFVIMSVLVYFVSNVKLLSHLNKKFHINSKCTSLADEDKNTGFIQVNKRVIIHHPPVIVEDSTGAFLEVKQCERRPKVDDEISFDDEKDNNDSYDGDDNDDDKRHSVCHCN